MRRCLWCDLPLEQRLDEKPHLYRKRRTCNRACSAQHREFWKRQQVTTEKTDG